LPDGAGLIAEREVLGGAGALGDLAGEGPALPIGAGVHVAEEGVGGLADAIDAAFLLDRGDGPDRHAEIEQ
jgi:hypothetical protein